MLCPLCQKECISSEEHGGALPPTYSCPTMVRTGGDGGRYHTESHFVRYITGGWSTGLYYLERAVFPPYKLENHCTGNVAQPKPHSSIYVMGPNPRYRPRLRDVNKTCFKQVLKTPIIHMDTEDKLSERIRLILLFS